MINSGDITVSINNIRICIQKEIEKDQTAQSVLCDYLITHELWFKIKNLNPMDIIFFLHTLKSFKEI